MAEWQRISCGVHKVQSVHPGILLCPRYCCILPLHLAERVHQMADVQVCCHLHAAGITKVIINPTRQSTLGDRAFPVTALWVRNTLSVVIRTVPSTCINFGTSTMAEN